MKAITLEFKKYQSSGNDFVLIDEDRNHGITEDVRKALSKILMDRHFSVGADSILFVRRESAGIRYRVYEEDIELEMCGNGLLCAADYSLAARGPRGQVFITKGDVFRSVTRDNKLFTADLGRLQPVARFLKRKVDDSLLMIGMTTLLPGRKPAAVLRGLGVSIDQGFFVNPSEAHVVFLVEDISAVDLSRLGDYIAGRTKVFPESTNVNICQRISQRVVGIRTYERGKFKETLACGTGSAASAYVAKAIFKLRGGNICVRNPGGDLNIRIDGGSMFLTGSATKVFHGTILVNLQKPRMSREG
jgi:diaminopimelate epimerase